MTEQKTKAVMQKRMEALTLADDLDEMITAGAESYLMASAGGMAQTISLAVAVAEIEKALTPEIMKPIMSLQGKAIGFKADKTYSVEIVKQAMVEALMVGIPMAGNCMNIISGRCYVTKEGFTFKLKQLQSDGVIGNFRFELSPPEKKEGRTVVLGSAEWDQAGEHHKLERTFPIKTNGGSTDDNTLGKAERKLRKACYEQMTGVTLPDGDAEPENLKPAKGVEEIGREVELSDAKLDAYEKLKDFRIEHLTEAFESNGYVSESSDKLLWLDEVLEQVKTIEKLNNIISYAEKVAAK